MGEQASSPSSTFDDIQKQILQQIVKAIIDEIISQLSEDRSVVSIIDNQTDYSLRRMAVQHYHGGFGETPSPFIGPKTVEVFSSQSVGGSVATGTEGFVEYASEHFTLKAYWNNPFFGGNEARAELSGARPEIVTAEAIAGAGDEKAEMRFDLLPIGRGPLWGPWESLGGRLASAPAVVSWAPGRLDIFARSPDDTLEHLWFR